MIHARSHLVPALIVAASATTVQGQPVPNYDFQWATVGDVGNAPYPGGAFGANAGRGRVDYAYRISTLETSTGQWLEFLNAVSPLFPQTSNWGRPAGWGAQIDPTYSGPGDRYVLDPNRPNAAMVPLYGMSWRSAAYFCNWLHNGKVATLGAVGNGAYDTATFTSNANGSFNDQLTRSPGARFWIPSLDEWLKAAHYDPNKGGAGQAGWWEQPNRSDIPMLPGLPGEGQTTAGLELPMLAERYLPLGSYAPLSSAYGLLDTSGAGMEWLEDIASPDRRYRHADGTYAGGTLTNDRVEVTANGSVFFAFGNGFTGVRIAGVVPSPHYALPLGLMWFARRRRMRCTP